MKKSKKIYTRFLLAGFLLKEKLAYALYTPIKKV